MLSTLSIFLLAIAGTLATPVHYIGPRAGDPGDLLLHHSLEIRAEPPLLRNATDSDIKEARAIVKDAISKSSKLNKARLDHPMRNIYKMAPGTNAGAQGRSSAKSADEEEPPPLLTVTPKIAAAAALLAEVDAAADSSGETLLQKRGTFWMEHISRKGQYPTSWGGLSGYKVFRNVKDYGARGDGSTDDTAAINKAIMDGDRCGEKCNGATDRNAIVYFPPGTYLVSSTIQVVFGTQMIGDALEWPRIVAASSFVGLGVMSTNEYVPDGGDGPDGHAKQWYINTARFFSQIRNFVIDITRTDPNAYICALHYQIAQASSLEDVELIATTGTTQQGMFAENGSGGTMADVIFNGGNFGFYGGNQQFTAQRMTFKGCSTAVQIIWDWGWIWKSARVSDCDVGFRLLGEGGEGAIGSVAFVDSIFNNVPDAIVIGGVNKEPGSETTGLIIENCAFNNVENRVVTSSNSAVLSGQGPVTHWVLGPTYEGGDRTWQDGTDSLEKPRESSLVEETSSGLPGPRYYERGRPQYTHLDAGDIIHIKDFGAKGDGVTDDTKAVQEAFDAAGSGSVLLVDNGVYMIHETVTIPEGAYVVGECWPSFVATGSYFSDVDDPKVMLRVGEEGDVGTIEVQDFLVMTKGGAPGAILIEWNIQASAQGTAALWDVHARVGGATGTEQNPADCPPTTDGTNGPECQAAHMLMHLTPNASGLFDNMWLWVADHLIDDPLLDDEDNNMDQLSIYVSRGFLIESKNAVWLYGTASEHCVMYQYNFHNARNVYAGMVQTEPPYFQPTPKAPAPFEAGLWDSDPDYSCSGDDFDGCDTAWAVVITGSENIMIAAAGTYSWFDTYTQDCIGEHACQKAIWFLKDNYDNVRLQHVITIGGKYSIVSDGKGILATDNLATKEHPRWSHISLFDADSQGSQPGDDDDDDDDDNSECDSSEGTWTDPGEPEGEKYPAPGPSIPEWDEAVRGDITYVTIINLTPYDFEYITEGKPEPYQVEMDFYDVPSGHVRQCKTKYSAWGSNRKDDRGEAHYRIKGTGEEFVIISTHNIDNPESPYPLRSQIKMGGFGLETREFKGRGGQRAVNLVITGSEEYGSYYTSTYTPPIAWMKELRDVIGPRTMNHVVMPGTHDSGMSVMGKYNWGAAPRRTTQTQAYNLYDQLRLGARWLDLRLIGVTNVDGASGFEFHTAHTCFPCRDHQGATGIRGSEVVEMLNDFTDEYPGEVIIVWVQYLWVRDSIEVRSMTDEEGEETLKLLRRIKRRCGKDVLTNRRGRKFDKVEMNEFMRQNDGEGCVLIMMDESDVLGPRTDIRDDEAGIYNGPENMARLDNWPEAETRSQVIKSNVEAWTDIRKKEDDKFMIAQWLLTPFILDSLTLGLEALAVRDLYDALYWEGVGRMSPSSFPNVIMLDYLGVVIEEFRGWDEADHEVRALAMGLNLYMVSENCDISNISHPLHRPKANARQVDSLLVNNTVRVEEDLFRKLDLEPLPEDVERRMINRRGS